MERHRCGTCFFGNGVLGEDHGGHESEEAVMLSDMDQMAEPVTYHPNNEVDWDMKSASAVGAACPSCPHLRTHSRGSNAYFRRVTCKDCGQVLVNQRVDQKCPRRAQRESASITT